MPFCTTKRWETKRWGTKTIDRIDSAPTAILDAWGIPIRKRWIDPSRQDVTTIDNGKRFVIDDDTTLRWEHDSKTGQFEGGQFKETIQLDKAPADARWSTRLELPHGVRFYRQPALTQREIDDGDERPEWCVGSYAVFDATGCKIGHVPRPYAVTADGQRRWFDLQIDRSPAWGVYMTVLGDLAWLKGLPKSAFPVLVDPTFGYTTVGGTQTGTSPRLWASGLYGPAASGTGDSVTVYIGKFSGTNIVTTLGLYEDNAGYPGALTEDTGEISVTNHPPAWKTSNLDTNPALVSGTNYWLSLHVGIEWSRIYYDIGTKALKCKATAYTAGTLPDPFPAGASTTANRDYSIYVTYTETVGGTLFGLQTAAGKLLLST